MNFTHGSLFSGIAEGGIFGIRPANSEMQKSSIVFQLLTAVTSAPLLAILMLVAGFFLGCKI